MIKNFRLLKGGYCEQLERISIKSGRWKKIEFPSLFSVMYHPKNGNFMFDTGYSPEFFKAAANFPYSIYPLVTPINLRERESAVEQLKFFNIDAISVSNIFISHFHGDHIAGIKDFPSASFICSKTEYDYFRNKKGFVALGKAFLPNLIPDNFNSRVRFIEDFKPINIAKQIAPFEQGYDLFEDQSLIAISLPGHSAGQYGLLIKTTEAEYFMVGDACWSCEAYRSDIPPSRLASIIFDKWKIYLRTLNFLNQLALRRPDLRIIPSHCNHAFKKWGCHE